MRFEGQTFRNQAVELDFNHYVRCRFEGCNIVIRALSPLAFEECRFESCNFHFDGPAALTLSVLRSLHQSIPGVAEMAIQVIRGEATAAPTH